MIIFFFAFTFRFVVKKVLRLENGDMWKRYCTRRNEILENMPMKTASAPTVPHLLTRGVLVPGSLPLMFAEVREWGGGRRRKTGAMRT